MACAFRYVDKDAIEISNLHFDLIGYTSRPPKQLHRCFQNPQWKFIGYSQHLQLVVSSIEPLGDCLAETKFPSKPPEDLFRTNQAIFPKNDTPSAQPAMPPMVMCQARDSKWF
jgi:hypothetical protein